MERCRSVSYCKHEVREIERTGSDLDSNFFFYYFPTLFIPRTANHCGLPNEYWLNGNDTDNSGTFTWIDGKIQTTFTNWLPGEPSDAAGVPAECVVSATGVKGVWLDITCASTRRVVCERNF